jgi:hypothetical protein
MTRLLLLATSAWIAFTMLLADLLGLGPDPAATHRAVLVQYAGLFVVCAVFAVRRRGAR